MLLVNQRILQFFFATVICLLSIILANNVLDYVSVTQLGIAPASGSELYSITPTVSQTPTSKEPIFQHWPFVNHITNNNAMASAKPNASSQIDGQTVDNYRQYTNPILGIKLSYPADWYKASENAGPASSDITFYPVAGNITAGLSAGVQRWNQSVAFLDTDLNDKIIDYRTSIPGFKLIKADSNSLLGGQYAYRLEYESNDGSGPLIQTEFGTAVDTTNLYYVHFYANSQSYNNLLPTFNKIVDSFQVVPTGPKEQNTQGAYIEIGNYSGMLWNKDNLNVYIVVDPSKDKQSLAHINDAVHAVNDWSHLLKNYSGNDKAWNFTIFRSNGPVQFGPDQQVISKFNPPADIIIQLLEDAQGMRCEVDPITQIAQGEGQSYGFPTDPYGPVYSYAVTSCGPAKSYYEYDSQHVYSLVSHEFAHDLGLMHAHNSTGDLMCGYCLSGLHPTPMDIKALIYMYGKDGFAIPNSNLKEGDIYNTDMPYPQESPYDISGVDGTHRFVNYVNSAFGISTEYPSHWSVQSSKQLPANVSFYPLLGNHGTDPNTHIDIYYFKSRDNQNQEPLSLKQTRDATIDYYKSAYHNFQLLNSSINAKFVGRDAYMVAGKYEDPSTGIAHVMQIGTNTDKAGSSISIEVFTDASDKYSSDIHHILNTLKYS